MALTGPSLRAPLGMSIIYSIKSFLPWINIFVPKKKCMPILPKKHNLYLLNF